MDLKNVEAACTFLKAMGIEAEFHTDQYKETLIVITNAQFDLRRAYIERWFTTIKQYAGMTYLQERQRGTGDTR